MPKDTIPKDAMLTVKCTREQLAKFNAYARSIDRPLSMIVREALTARINRAEKTQLTDDPVRPLEITFK